MNNLEISNSIDIFQKVFLISSHLHTNEQNYVLHKMNSLYQIRSKMLHGTKVITYILEHLKK